MDITNYEFFQEPEMYETVNGKIVMMPRPTLEHSRIVSKLAHYWYICKKCDCNMYIEPNLYLEQQHLIPDLAIVCDKSKLHEIGIYGAPDVVIEVLSPTTFQHDKFVKSKVYAQYGVLEYWLVYPREKEIEIYCLNNKNGYTLHHKFNLDGNTQVKSTVIPNFEFSMSDLFDV